MNPYTVTILTALLLEYGLFVLAERLNLRALDPELPPDFAGVLDPERYRRSQEYTHARSRFGVLVRTALLAALLAFWSLSGFERLHTALAGLPGLWGGLSFLGALFLLHTLVALPFRWWSTFRIEERFGFNLTTDRTFWADTAKSILVFAAIAGPLFALGLWILSRWRAQWTPLLLLIPIAIGALVLLLQLLSTAVILPLFLRFESLADGPVKEALLALARRVGFRTRGVYVVDGSRRSTKANAFFTGLGRTRRIALFDTLLERHSTDELLGVVAHELGHWRLRHVWLRGAMSVATLSVMAGLLLLAVSDARLTAALGVAEPAPHVALVAFGLLFTPAEVLLGLLSHALSRRQEYAADAFAAATTGNPEALAKALERLASDSLTNLTPHPFYVSLHHGHPPLRSRLAALRSQ